MTNSDDWVKFSLDLRIVNDPGAVWAYNSSNAVILGGIIANASKMSVSKFADTFLFRPLGIKNYRWTKDPLGHGMTAGSFYIHLLTQLNRAIGIKQRDMEGQKNCFKKWIEEATQRIHAN
jgi:CubicO group peptidase (beta-lactamase class C family)